MSGTGAASPPAPHRASRLAAVQFAVSVSAVLLVVTTAGLVALRHVAREHALREATDLSRVLADAVVAPQVDRSLVDGDPAAVARLDGVLADGNVLGDRVVRVKIWTPQGGIVYSDEHRLIGAAVTPSGEVLEVGRTGLPRAEVSDLAHEENGFERGTGPLLEVYVPLVGSDGTRLVAETYQPLAGVAAESGAIWRAVLPVLVLVVLALALAQVPLARRYGRQSRAQAEERLALLTRADAARQDERTRIAADLHDSVVQDLAGVAFDLAAHANQVDRRSRDELVTALRNGADVCRQSIATLRSLLVQLHPAEPAAPAPDLAHELPELTADLRRRGVRVDVRVAPVCVDPELGALLHRAAQEGVRNVARHAAATRATISLTEHDGLVTLLVEDDGQGMTSRDLARQRAAGHVGLTLLADRIRSRQGGDLTISSEPGRGTRLTVSLPLPGGASDHPTDGTTRRTTDGTTELTTALTTDPTTGRPEGRQEVVTPR